jgi:hypothetical protein
VKTVLRNIATIVSGDLARPLWPGDTIVVEDGRFSAISWERELALAGATRSSTPSR